VKGLLGREFFGFENPSGSVGCTSLATEASVSNLVMSRPSLSLDILIPHLSRLGQNLRSHDDIDECTYGVRIFAFRKSDRLSRLHIFRRSGACIEFGDDKTISFRSYVFIPHLSLLDQNW
jgi:hypothetical protein